MVTVEHPRLGTLVILCEDAEEVSLWLKAHIDTTHTKITIIEEPNND